MSKLTGLILCGGKGTRLYPLTENIPKPLLELNNKPILSYIIEHFRKFGIEDIYITIKHFKEKLIDYAKIKNIKTLEIYNELRYEIGNIWPDLKFNTDVIMSVGDTITDININELYKFHKKNKADMTIASKILEYKIPFGCMKKRGNILKQWLEKPEYKNEVALGVFIIDKDLFNLVPKRKFDIPDFINLLLEKEKKICIYPYYKEYIKVDTLKEYEDAKIKIKLLHID